MHADVARSAKPHRPEGSHGPARLDAEPRAILEEGNNFEALFARQAVPHIVDLVRVFVVAAGRARAGDQPFLRAEGVGEAAAQAVEGRFQVGPEGEAEQGVVGDRATETPVRVVQELAFVARTNVVEHLLAVAAPALALEARLLVLIRVTLKSIWVFGLDDGAEPRERRRDARRVQKRRAAQARRGGRRRLRLCLFGVRAAAAETLQLFFQVQCMSWVCGQAECEQSRISQGHG